MQALTAEQKAVSIYYDEANDAWLAEVINEITGEIEQRELSSLPASRRLYSMAHRIMEIRRETEITERDIKDNISQLQARLKFLSDRNERQAGHLSQQAEAIIQSGELDEALPTDTKKRFYYPVSDIGKFAFSVKPDKVDSARFNEMPKEERTAFAQQFLGKGLFKEKTEYSPDKKAIKAALLAGDMDIAQAGFEYVDKREVFEFKPAR